MKREERQLEFINNNRLAILSECLKHKNETGYARALADENFKLVSLKFIAKEFDPREFINTLGTPPKMETPPDVVLNVYFEILWLDNKTKWQGREIVLQKGQD